MNVYASHDKHRERMKERFGDAVRIVDAKSAADIIISGVFKAEDAQANTRAIIVPYTGLDAIDLDVVEREGIALFNTTVHSPYVAEKAIHLLFATLGKVIPYHDRLRRGDWSGRGTEGRIVWESVFRKRIGIFGYGRIGRCIAAMLEPFDVEIHLLDRGKEPAGAIRHPDLRSLVAASDVVFIAAPLTPSTRHAFDSEVLSNMAHAHLVNVGRGPIVDEDALYEALQKKTLKSYASDVWYDYPKQGETSKAPSKHPLHHFENVVMSPHVAGMCETSEEELTEAALDTLERLMADDYSGALLPGDSKART